MATRLSTTSGVDRNNPYLAQWYASLGVPLNQPVEGANDLRNALEQYNFHLRNRRNIAQERPRTNY